MVRMAISRWTTPALRTSLQDAAGSSIIKQIWLLDENPMTEAEFLEKFHMELDDQQRAAMRIAGRHALLLALRFPAQQQRKCGAGLPKPLHCHHRKHPLSARSTVFAGAYFPGIARAQVYRCRI